jgi:5-methylcytosine-specific restriction protein B
LVFHAKAGVFLRLCRATEKHQLPAVLIIDEINRGNLPKLLGELVYALEYRGHEVKLPFNCDGRSDLIVPKNLYIIATMNSADRSIGHIDVAIRRRFGLYHLPPNSDVVQNVWSMAGDASYGLQLAKLMKRLNNMLGTGNDPSAEAELGVGHSYFLPSPDSSGDDAKRQVQMKWEYQVQPLLREYAQLLNLGADYQAFFKKSLDQALAEP